MGTVSYDETFDGIRSNLNLSNGFETLVGAVLKIEWRVVDSSVPLAYQEHATVERMRFEPSGNIVICFIGGWGPDLRLVWRVQGRVWVIQGPSGEFHSCAVSFIKER